MQNPGWWKLREQRDRWGKVDGDFKGTDKIGWVMGTRMFY